MRHDPDAFTAQGRRLDDDEPRGKANGSKPARFNAVRLDKIQIPKARKALVEDILFPRDLAVIFGESGCGKSFLASYMALHIAASLRWAGKTCLGGAVVYITAEGATGFLKRMVAARQRFPELAGAPFFVITDAPDLGHVNADAEIIIDRIREQAGDNIALVVVDTMSRVMQGADENSATDVSVLVNNTGTIITALGCTLVLVHHSGKDASRGARGSSVLRAAADTEILVEKTEIGRVASVTKQKDAEGGLTLSFELEQVDIEGCDGETSCVVHAEAWQAEGGQKRAKVTGPTLVALRSLEEALVDHGETAPASTLLGRTKRVVRMTHWREACARVQITETDTPDAKRKAFTRAAEKLQTTGIIGVYDEFVWLNR